MSFRAVSSSTHRDYKYDLFKLFFKEKRILVIQAMAENAHDIFLGVFFYSGGVFVESCIVVGGVVCVWWCFVERGCWWWCRMQLFKMVAPR